MMSQRTSHEVRCAVAKQATLITIPSSSTRMAIASTVVLAIAILVPIFDFSVCLTRHFFQAPVTSPIYMVWTPAGKLEYICRGTSSLKYCGSNGAAYIVRHSSTNDAST